MLNVPAVSKNKFVVNYWLNFNSYVVKIKAAIRKPSLKIDLKGL